MEAEVVQAAHNRTSSHHSNNYTIATAATPNLFFFHHEKDFFHHNKSEPSLSNEGRKKDCSLYIHTICLSENMDNAFLDMTE